MSRYGPQIAALARRAVRDRRWIDRQDPDTLDEELATSYLREGVGPAIWIYVEGRTGGRRVPFSPAELEALETAMNDWLECYTYCYGVEFDAAFTVREAAELLLETRNVHDVGLFLTGVPRQER